MLPFLVHTANYYTSENLFFFLVFLVIAFLVFVFLSRYTDRHHHHHEDDDELTD